MAPKLSLIPFSSYYLNKADYRKTYFQAIIHWNILGKIKYLFRHLGIIHNDGQRFLTIFDMAIVLLFPKPHDYCKNIYWPFLSALVPLSVMSFAILFSSYVKIGGKADRRNHGKFLLCFIQLKSLREYCEEEMWVWVKTHVYTLWWFDKKKSLENSSNHCKV